MANYQLKLTPPSGKKPSPSIEKKISAILEWEWRKKVNGNWGDPFYGPLQAKIEDSLEVSFDSCNVQWGEVEIFLDVLNNKPIPGPLFNGKVYNGTPHVEPQKKWVTWDAPLQNETGTNDYPCRFSVVVLWSPPPPNGVTLSSISSIYRVHDPEVIVGKST